MPRPPRPDDVARFRIPTDPRLSPDGGLVAWTMQTVAPGYDGYRHAIWSAPADGSAPPRQLTIGARHDRSPRFAPDGGGLAFLSDRRLLVEEEPSAPRERDREDGTQVHLLPLGGGEARRITDLPRGVDAFEWSPDGTRLVVQSTSRGATRKEDARRRGKDPAPKPGTPPESDYRYTDRLSYQANGAGFINDKVGHLWLVEVATGAIRRLTPDGPTAEEDATWSPDGTRVAFVANRRPDHDLRFRSDIYVVDVETGQQTRITGGDDALFGLPTWLPDGRTIAALGGRYPDGLYRADVWVFAADGSDAGPDGGRNLTGCHDIMPASTMNSDLQPSEGARLRPSADGAWLTLTAPALGSYELWRVGVADGTLERLTEDRHWISSFDQRTLPDGTARIAYVRSTAIVPGDVHLLDCRPTGGRRKRARLTDFHAELVAELSLVEPIERRVEVEGREIQGWLLPGAAGKQPLVTEIHGGPHTLYGYAPMWEFQVLAGSGLSVYYSNPRGSEGYGLEFNRANLRDWGPGPTRDVLAGIDALVEDGLADPDRLGLTGGSYGGYLTNWIVGHDDRFRAAITCRSVADMGLLFLTGDISGGDWARAEFGTTPWEDPAYFREISPLTYADRIRTPLLIQHSERDIRTTVGQAEALFTVLRAKRRPVRLMRVPDESHELTRSGTPFRRVENLVQVRDWFLHFLVRNGRELPPLPRRRGGK